MIYKFYIQIIKILKSKILSPTINIIKVFKSLSF